jgi:hypothetical protein
MESKGKTGHGLTTETMPLSSPSRCLNPLVPGQSIRNLFDRPRAETGSGNEASLHAPAKTIPCRWVIKQKLKRVAIPYRTRPI